MYNYEIPVSRAALITGSKCLYTFSPRYGWCIASSVPHLCFEIIYNFNPVKSCKVEGKLKISNFKIQFTLKDLDWM